jgi:uncharacterized membrane protein YidH (DUF202 family)
MNAIKILGILLIVAGVLALVFGGFRYTRKSRTTRLGAIEMSVKSRRRVIVPLWAGVALIVVGVVLLLVPG